ncbi:MAG: type II secretion system F family protein [Candidatus Woesearchaeota archaeon]
MRNFSHGEAEKALSQLEYAEKLAEDMLSLFYELRNYYELKQETLSELKRLEEDYQNRRYNYEQFSKRLSSLLEGKSKSEFISEYNQQLLNIGLRIENLNSRLFHTIYHSEAHILISQILAELREEEFELINKLKEKKREGHIKEEIAEQMAISEKIEPTQTSEVNLVGGAAAQRVQNPVDKKDVAAKDKKRNYENVGMRILQIMSAPFRVVFESFRELFRGKEEKKLGREFKFSEKTEVKRVRIKKPELPHTKKKEEGAFKSPLAGFFKIRPFRKIREQILASDDFLSEENYVPITVELIKEGSKPEELRRTLLLKESERIERIINKSKAYFTRGTPTLAVIANISVRQLTHRLIVLFPSFFKTIYKNLRGADVRMLSNTYANMMVFFSIVAFIFGIGIGLPVSVALGNGIALAIIKSVILGIIFGAACTYGFYAYPKLQMQQRIRSIKSNLPFALNHMAAISSSGSPPIMIFKLIGSSPDYGEISVEFQKIVDYVEIFGFDPVTAIKNVASNTPSKELKELLEGLVSTLKAGGEIKSMLRQKAEEALNNYRLELQNYNETIATYSDMYTGILIAAPLFFIVTLAMVSILGGNVGNMNIGTLMVVSTYVAIPILNVLFLVFLEMSQPNI